MAVLTTSTTTNSRTRSLANIVFTANPNTTSALIMSQLFSESTVSGRSVSSSNSSACTDLNNYKSLQATPSDRHNEYFDHSFGGGGDLAEVVVNSQWCLLQQQRVPWRGETCCPEHLYKEKPQYKWGIKSTGAFQYDECSEEDDEDVDDEVLLLRRMYADGFGRSESFVSDSEDSGCESDDLSFSTSLDQLNDLEFMVEFGKKPCVFDDAATMKFYISPLAITHLASGLWTRSVPACIIINTSIPKGKRFDDMDWSEDAMRMLNTPNAGGSSLLSEVLSCEMLSRCLGATLAKTEMEIQYLFAYQPITDYTITLPNLSPRMHVGVSVTRAFAFKGAYRKVDCRKLLWKKLSGILASSRNVIGERFFKQILHVWVPNGKVARTVQATYKSMPIEVTRNTIVIISVVNASWVFSNRR
ncbi:hypothetical protein BGZ76_009168 [Entomortierella beljakovae]|nr:hypothetical protein BGZ76_009168 [Entomortierella beljakovae]